MTIQPTKNFKLLCALYAAINDKDIATAMTLVSETVVWQRTLSNSYIRGSEDLLSYWLQESGEISISIVPLSFQLEDKSHILVQVHQTIHANGELLNKNDAIHRFTVSNGLVKKMECCLT